MTRRERLERKVERRLEWAQGHEQKAESLHRSNDRYRGDVAFNTQPGHIPERARAIRRTEKAFEHSRTAKYHTGKAAGLQDQLDRTIFSDDHDAIEKLEEKIAKLEMDRERMKKANAIVRKKKLTNDEKVQQLMDSLGFGKRMAQTLLEPDFCGRYGFASFELSNRGAEIRRAKQRIDDIKLRNQRAAAAEAAGGVLVEKLANGYCRVTFEEKPERDVLNALRDAGFYWGGGCWSGQHGRLPDAVKSLIA